MYKDTSRVATAGCGMPRTIDAINKVVRWVQNDVALPDKSFHMQWPTIIFLENSSSSVWILLVTRICRLPLDEFSDRFLDGAEWHGFS